MIAPLVAELNKQRAAAGLAPFVATPEFERISMYEAFSDLATPGSFNADTLAAGCELYGWQMGWSYGFTSAKDAVSTWMDMKNTTWRQLILNTACSTGPEQPCAVGVGIAVKGSKSMWLLTVNQDAGQNPDPDQTLNVWPIDGWPDIPTTTTLPSSGDGGWSGNTTPPDTKRVCFTSSGCGEVGTDTTWNLDLDGSRVDGNLSSDVELCVYLQSWNDGSDGSLTQRLAASSLYLHLDNTTTKIANPGWWTDAGDSSKSCADLNLPKNKPRFGRHTVWFTVATPAGGTLTTSKESYGLPFVPVAVFNYSRPKLISVNGRPSYDLISASIGSPLFRLASAAHPITLACVEVRSNGSVRKIDQTVVLRKAGSPRCQWRVRPPFGVELEARVVKMTPWLKAQLAGTPLRYAGVRFG